MDEKQESIDRFYHQHGPCCAGCDWWAWLNTRVGECRRSAPVSDAEKWAMLGIEGVSLAAGAGHVVTPRKHLCGEFRDGFDWSSLPSAYRARIGVPRPLALPSGAVAVEGE